MNINFDTAKDSADESVGVVLEKGKAIELPKRKVLNIADSFIFAVRIITQNKYTIRAINRIKKNE